MQWDDVDMYWVVCWRVFRGALRIHGTGAGSSNSIGEAAPLQLGQMLLESVQHTGQAYSLEQTAQVQEIGTETLAKGWWFQIVFIVTPNLGKIPVLTSSFQRVWNHQL